MRSRGSPRQFLEALNVDQMDAIARHRPPPLLGLQKEHATKCKWALGMQQ